MKVKEAIEYFKDFYKDFDDLHAIKLIESFHIPIEKY